MIALLSRHLVFVVYLLSLLWLSAATFIYSWLADRSPEQVLYVLGVTIGTTVVYATVLKLLERHPPWAADLLVPPAGTVTPQVRKLLTLLVCLYGIIAFGHFLMLGGIPAVEALTADTERGTSIVRQQGYFGLPTFMRYASDYSAKALGPALLLVTYYFRSRLFWVVLAIGVFYSSGMFVRILPITLLAPLALLMVIQRRWLHATGVLVLLSFQLAFAAAVASPAIRLAVEPVTYQDGKSSIQQDGKPDNHQADKPDSHQEGDWRRTSIAYSYYDRTLIVPGQVIDQWFQYYEQPDQRERGCGYRLLAPLLGCSFVPIPSKLYAFFYPENVSQGMWGSLNAASFMTEFANFGPAGFILSTLMGGLLFVAVALIYRHHPLALPMNLPLIVISTETSLPTALNSGSGWLVMTAVFVLFFRLPVR